MDQVQQSISRVLNQGIRRTQFLAQATAAFNYDELKSFMTTAAQVFVFKEYALIQSTVGMSRVSEDSIYTNKKLFVYFAKQIIDLGSKRSFDRKMGRFYDLTLKERIILVSHFVLKMDWDLLSEIIDLTEETINDSLVRAESYLVNDQKLYEDLTVLTNECSKATKTLTFARNTLNADKSDQLVEHVNDCKVCHKIFNHVKASQDQLLKHVPTIELETNDIKDIVKKALEAYEENKTRNLSLWQKGARRVLDFFSY